MEIRRANIRVDFGPQALANSNRAELVMLVVRDYHLAGRDQPANLLDAQPFVLGYFDHLLSDNAFARSFKLSHVATSCRSLDTDIRIRRCRGLVIYRLILAFTSRCAPLIPHPPGLCAIYARLSHPLDPCATFVQPLPCGDPRTRYRRSAAFLMATFARTRSARDRRAGSREHLYTPEPAPRHANREPRPAR